MDANRDAHLIRCRPRRLKLIRVQCVIGMRSENRNDATVLIFPAADELEAFSDRICGVLRIGASLVNDRSGNHCAHSAGLDNIRDNVGKVIHVDKHRGTAAYHLPAREFRADANEVRVDKLDLRRKNIVVQPVHERQVVCHAAQQGHRGMRVAVDEAGHDNPVVASQVLGGYVSRVHIRGRGKCNDQTVLDCDRAAFNDRLVLIHCDDVLTLYNEVDGW